MLLSKIKADLKKQPDIINKHKIFERQQIQQIVVWFLLKVNYFQKF